MTKNELHFRLIEIFNELEAEIVKPAQIDSGGIVTNHMAAVWTARDAMNELFEVEAEPVA